MVQDARNENNFLIRSRCFKHLVDFAGENYPINTTPSADYDFRCLMPKVIFAEHLIMKVAGITYTNFKESVPDASYKALLMQLWLSTKLWF